MMLGHLQGQVIEKQPAWLIVGVQGVGYEVEVPLSVFASLPDKGEPVSLWIHHLVREDAQLLFGFLRLEDRQLFRELIRISGIGPKVALAILSSMETPQLLQVIQNEDITALTRVPGIGKKTAERLLLDLRDRLKGWQPQQVARLGEQTPLIATPSVDPIAEAEAGLITLGYKPVDASKAVKSVMQEGMSTSELIMAALKGLGR